MSVSAAQEKGRTDSHVFWSRVSYAVAIVGGLGSLLITISVPLLLAKTAQMTSDAQIRSLQFRMESDRVWDELQSLANDGMVQSDVGQAPIFFSRRKRASPWDFVFCQGCTQLACPQGSPGTAGIPGLDGLPGAAGNSGPAGEDGFDVELAPEDDLPCIICPAGPPGPRGPQGERGFLGDKGVRGDPGVDGAPGAFGRGGLYGPPGARGPPGLLGPSGIAGEGKIAGIGVKGARGPPGPPGSIGPQGPPGRASKQGGAPGQTGQPGLIGPPGAVGRIGDDGPYGPPGDPGQPAAYCSSDCGVANILAPALEEKLPSYLREEALAASAAVQQDYHDRNQQQRPTPPNAPLYAAGQQPPYRMHSN